MFQRRSVPYVLSALIAAAILVWFVRQSGDAQAQTNISPAVQPKAPVQITMTSAVANDELPTRLAGKAFVQTYVLQNLSSANVLAIATRWTPKDAEGGSLPGAGCSSQSAVRTDLPVLKGGESKTFQQTLAHGGAPSTEAEIDLVLLDDGTAFGSNRCGELGKIQARLDGMKMTYLAMLRVLETRGPQALEDLLRARAEEYGQPGHNDAFMNPRFIGR